MYLFFNILVAVYLLSINAYPFLLFKLERDNESEDKPIKIFKLLLIALFGGSIGTLVAVIIFKYKLKRAVFIISLPLIAVLNVYLSYMWFSGGILSIF